MATLPDEVRVWVAERKPKTTAKAAQLADDYLQAHASGTLPTTKSPRLPTGPCPRCRQHGHWARECPNNSKSEGPTYQRNYGSRAPQFGPGAQTSGKGPRTYPPRTAMEPRPQYLDGVRCYSCGEKGHVASNCSRKALYCAPSPPQRATTQQDQVHHSGTINGVYCRDIVIDTGASRTLVHGNLVSESDLVGGEITIRCAHGDVVAYPLATVKIAIGSRDITVQAAVAKALPVAALLGWDIPELMELVGNDKPPVDALVAVTRSQRQKQMLTEPNAPSDRETPTAPVCAEPPNPPIETDGPDDSDRTPELVFNFDDDLFSPAGRNKQMLTRGQRRENNRRYAESRDSESRSPADGVPSLDIAAEQLRALQEEDPTLVHARNVADDESSTRSDREFLRRDGLLYRRYLPPGVRDPEHAAEQLVLPMQCRQSVLKLAHNIPMAGHLGRRKTTNRTLQRFYWPGIFRDVSDHCRSCEQCQKSSPRGVKKAPLVPLPIMDVPFKRIAMDIVGPLPRSSSGKRFILVMCDYATRYPEAVALRTIDAARIAKELMSLFARVGVPEEILTDQGANFTSGLLQEVYRLMGIKPIRTSPYHPQTDGLVERFNHTLKSMLRKTASEEGKDWDDLLPYLLFAYREVPQASTGFSPFELLYGRPVRGPLDILRESWEAKERSTESVVSYVLVMQERLTKLRELVRENLEQAQESQKSWYDKNARSRHFQPGDQVLVLLPTSSHKLLAEWQGPYAVTKRVGKVDYEVRMTDRRKPNRVFHVNMLREWHSPSGTSCWAEEIPNGDDSDEIDDIVTWSSLGDSGQPVVGDQLSPDKLGDIQSLWARFAMVLDENPGRTTVTEHHIKTGEASPIRLPPYRIPYAYRDTVQNELKEMEQAGIIERSSSEWAAPIVLVKKKDSTLRMCVDYRRLNAVSQMDAYPMPRVDELIDRLGDAKFITTLDLSRGYWQVPVSPKDQAKTAFTTPYGLFQFRVMPFGLQGAPATFQRLMDVILADIGDFAAAYLDDVVIHSGTWKDHLQHVGEVLRRLGSAGLTIKPKKCQFAMSHCSYLGHVVGNGEVRPEESKLLAVEAFPVPKTKSQVRAFLGLTGYYRRFIQDYAETANALTDLTRKNSPNRIVWSPECDKAFTQLKQSLCSSTVLCSPDFHRPFILQTDASNRGVGAVLSQHDDEGVERPVAYYSRKLLPREERYSTVEKECLAIKLAAQAFRVYLLGRPFIIQTDHRSLQWLDKLKDSNSRLTRWSLSLQPYCYSVNYRPGTANANADALSRAYDPTTSSQEKEGEM